MSAKKHKEINKSKINAKRKNENIKKCKSKLINLKKKKLQKTKMI